jgi:D-alanyl-D-alanine carboxypeptidase
MKFKRVIGGILLSLVFLVGFGYIISSIKLFFDSLQSKEIFLGSVYDSVIDIVPPIITKSDINAISAISLETNFQDINEIIFEKNSDVKLPIASLTKLMTGIIVLDIYDLSENIVVNKIIDLQDPIKNDVKLGDSFSVEDLLYMMLIQSSNTAAYTLSEGINNHPGEQEFVKLMNAKVKYLGLENTFFVDSTGLSSENVSTVNDLIKLTKHILENYPKIADISRVQEFYVPGIGNVVNTNELLKEIPNVVCSKTGFTRIANGCLLLVTSNPVNNNYIINIILGADNRFLEMEKLINMCKQNDNHCFKCYQSF